jgi:hypothetical protein
MAAWKIWLAYLAIGGLTVGSIFLRNPPFQFRLFVEISLTIATFLLFLTPIIFPNLTLQWPWSRGVDDQQWRRSYQQWAQSEEGKWYLGQKKALEEGAEVDAPWSAYPISDVFGGPIWGGWRQGTSEGWIKDIWYPFWRRLSKEERLTYLDKWQAPEDWREYLLPEERLSSLAAEERGTIVGHVFNVRLVSSAPDTAETTREDGDQET